MALPQTRLDGNFYPITESCELVTKHCRVASARFEPGNPDRERLDDVMECIIRPSVYILDCALRPANRDWLTPQELTMSELIYLHDAFSMVMAALFHLLEEGGQSFLNDGIRTNAGVYAPYVAFRGGCLRGLERLDEMLRQYLPESSTRVTPSPIHLTMHRALILGRAWQGFEDIEDFPAYCRGNTDDILMGFRQSPEH
ncbi:hypothetical protein C8F04DRAFT_1270156 [Mycena alexandri]|uniref:Uncharacterized protein n=1 Tax=Mycena alexandri TaxID=1745969 RepID=A0AAD6SBQ5_9AGAR|nr:hypothetical protein C8F04DRAFT_1270156 [Mycena alexandri]